MPARIKQGRPRAKRTKALPWLKERIVWMSERGGGFEFTEVGKRMTGDEVNVVDGQELSYKCSPSRPQ